MRLIDADKLEATAVLGVQLQHADSQYYYFYEEETIEKAPTVKAIPIEWIEQFMNRFRLDMVTSDEYALLHFMLTEWEKENEKRTV